jgi:hypothetical protein
MPVTVSPFRPQYKMLQCLPPRVRDAILEVHHKTGAPIEIIILVCLSAMSTALQGIAIRTPDGRLMPTSLYCMGIGPPVCGKSAAMGEFYKSIREFDARLGERRTSHSAFNGHPAFRDVLQLDATWGSLLEALDGTGSGLTIADDDCIDQLKSDVMKKRGKLNRFFDGAVKEPLIRRDHEPLVAYYPSVGICCLTQPEIYGEHLASTRYADRKSGLASRFLYAHTLEGRGPALSYLPTPALDEFHALASWFLEQRLQRRLAGTMLPLELCLSSEAQCLWEGLKEDIDERIHRDLEQVHDSAGRATEKTWRIAVCLHCFATGVLPASPFEPLPAIPPVPPEAIEAAWNIVEWSLGQFAQVFPPPKPKPPKVSRVRQRQLEETQDAKVHLYRHLRSSGGDTIPWSLAQQLSWLSPHKFKTVIAHMKSTKQVEELGGSDPVLRFSSLFLAEMGYKKSIAPERWSV